MKRLNFTGKDELLLLYYQLLKDLPVVRNQRRKEIDMEQLRLLTYKADYWKTVVKRKNDIWKRINEEAKLKMMKKVNVLTKALRKRAKKISMPEVESFSLELNRIVRYGDLLILESSGEFSQLKSQQEVVQFSQKANSLMNQLTRYTDALDNEVSDVIEKLKKALKSNAHLTAEEMKMINLAMQKSYYKGASAQGHWFKCRNGHTYTITECGGAMETAKCPVDGCGAVIGGSNHRYAEGQQLASEMDGATRPAWSSGYDMGNYDLNNLR